MKIKVSQIEVGEFTVREKLDKEHMDEIKGSLKTDGQWNPIIVRPNGVSKYDLVAGHYRLQAAKELGWKEIEATVKDLSDADADFLALKTNIIRATMSEMEEGVVLQRMMDKHGLSQRDVAKKLGKGNNWVRRRIALVLNIVPEVQKALSDGKISMDHAFLISQISAEKFKDWKDKQKEFLGLIVKNKWTRDQTRVQLKRFFNTTIFTIGYQGREVDEFVKVLKENEIDILVDVRFSAESQYKPEFSKKLLGKELKKNNIAYEHHPELGIPHVIQNPYKDGGFSFECLVQWYRWHMENEVDFQALVEHIKDAGKTAVMCMERYAKSQRDQEYHCHRHILANMINETLLFPERIDL